MSQLTPEERKQLRVAEAALFPSPIPVQSVSSNEFMPPPQTARQRKIEARVKELGADLHGDRIVEARGTHERDGTMG